MNSEELRKSKDELEKQIKLSPRGLVKRYLDYASTQEKLKVYWYLKAICIIPCVVMVPTIALMQLTTPNFYWFIGLSMLLFIGNIVVHIAELKSIIYVPFFHLTILIMILIPTINYLIKL